MQHKKFFSKEKGVVALISGSQVDFTPIDFDSPLSHLQRAYLYKKTGIDIPKVFWRKQIHGDDVLVASGGIDAAKGLPDADAYITNEKNLPIAIRTADCVPVLILDPVHHAIGVAHAGWKGTCKEIAVKTIKKMHAKYKSRPADLKIVLGPSIRKCCYKVTKEFYEYFPLHVKPRDGFLYADVVAANRDQLLKAGVHPENIFDSGICTCCNKRYFSFRRDGERAGRMMSLMMLK